MIESSDKLIKQLVAEHSPRPWWKTPILFFGIWFVSQLIYFAGLGFFKFDSLVIRFSLVYIYFITFGILISGAVFFHLSRHSKPGASFFKIWMMIFISLMSLALITESQVMGTVNHARSFSITHSDFTCFWHSVASTIGPVILFPLIFKQYFFSHPKWSMTFMSIHLSLMGSFLTELKCPDRELWHLILGHQTTFFGVAILITLATYYGRKANVLKA